MVKPLKDLFGIVHPDLLGGNDIKFDELFKLKWVGSTVQPPPKNVIQELKCFGLLFLFGFIGWKVDSYLPFVVCMVYVFCGFATYIYIYLQIF